jgi:uncharacterized protein (TIGR02266 family)
LVDRYYPNGKLGGLAVDGARPGVLGARVALTVRVRKPVREFTVHGQLAWARHKTPRQPASFGIDFLPDDDPTRVRLLAFARDEVDPGTVRVERRLQVELPVRLVHQKQARKELLADLSTGGAFVRTRNPVALGELVDLSVRIPGRLTSLSLKACVVWSRATGAAPGMGLAFVADNQTRGKLERVLARLARAADKG